MVGLGNSQLGMIGPLISVKGVKGDDARKWTELDKEELIGKT